VRLQTLGRDSTRPRASVRITEGVRDPHPLMQGRTGIPYATLSEWPSPTLVVPTCLSPQLNRAADRGRVDLPSNRHSWSIETRPPGRAPARPPTPACPSRALRGIAVRHYLVRPRVVPSGRPAMESSGTAHKLAPGHPLRQLANPRSSAAIQAIVRTHKRAPRCGGGELPAVTNHNRANPLAGTPSVIAPGIRVQESAAELQRPRLHLIPFTTGRIYARTLWTERERPALAPGPAVGALARMAHQWAATRTPWNRSGEPWPPREAGIRPAQKPRRVHFPLSKLQIPFSAQAESEPPGASIISDLLEAVDHARQNRSRTGSPSHADRTTPPAAEWAFAPSSPRASRLRLPSPSSTQQPRRPKSAKACGTASFRSPWP